MAGRPLTEQVKVGLAAGAIVAVGFGFILARLKAKAKENEAALDFFKNTTVFSIGRWSFNPYQTFVALLVAFALFGTVNYQRYNSRTYMDLLDSYDLLHYYINAKYFDELEYFRLVPALIIADDEEGQKCPGKAPIYLAQDENDYTIKPLSHALARADEIKSHFTEKRWEQFVHDVVFLQRRAGAGLSCNLWRMLIQDHGFNGTPVWVLIARPIASVVPVEWVKLCTWLDALLIVVMLAAIGWAFGAQAMAFCWIFITVCYSFRWPHIPWAYLRYDWFATMVIGICMVKKERFSLGGGFLAYATLMRYFPGLWLFAILGKAIHGLVTRRDVPVKRLWQRVDKRYWQMAFGFFITILVLVSASMMRDGVAAHKQSLENLAAHVQPHNLSSRRQGLAVTLTYRGEGDELKLISSEKKEIVASIEKAVRVVSILLIAVLALFLTRAKDWEAIGLGMIPYFMLTTSSYYYYILRMTGYLIHAADLSKARNVFGMVLLLSIEVFSNASEHINPGNRYFLISWMGILLSVYAIAMMGFFGYEWWKARQNDKQSG
jgi:hypothetical protein